MIPYLPAQLTGIGVAVFDVPPPAPRIADTVDKAHPNEQPVVEFWWKQQTPDKQYAHKKKAFEGENPTNSDKRGWRDKLDSFKQEAGGI